MSFTVSGKALIVVVLVVIASLGGGVIGGYSYGQMASKLEYQSSIAVLTQQNNALITKSNQLESANSALTANNTAYRQYATQLLQQNVILQTNNNLLTTQNNALTAENELLKQGSINPPGLGQTIKIGYIASDTISLETAKPYLEQIIAPDLNNYAKSLGYDLTFQFLIEDAQGQANIHLEKVQGFHSMGVNLIIGGGWSSQAQGSLSYMNSNNMLLVSTTSTSPTLAIANDRLFRMCAADTHLAPALADVMWAAGVKSVVIFQRGDSWGDGIVNLFVPIWTQMGGKVAGEKIRYASETTEFANYLTVADEQVKNAVSSYGGETQRVGVIILSFNEISVILKQVSSYPNIYNVHWWGSDGTAKSQRAMDNAPNEANHIGFYSLLSHETITPSFIALEQRYVSLTHQQYGMYSAYLYDAAFAIAKSIFETGSTDASKVSTIFPVICNSMYGVSGWCKLNTYGDRAAPPYDVWGFYPSATKASVSVIMAQYDPDYRKTIFITSVLGYTPIGP